MEEQLCVEHGLLTENFENISKVIHVDKIGNW